METTNINSGGQTRKRIITYLLIAFGLSFTAYAFIAVGREEGGGAGEDFGILLQFAPAIGAFATLLIYQRNIRGLGFGLGRARYLVLSYLLPMGVMVATYAVIWLLGLAGFDSEPLLEEAGSALGISNPILLVLAAIGLSATVSLLLFGFSR